MIAKNFPVSSRQILPLSVGGCVILIILLIMNRDYPFVGHDYAYFIPHILDTDLHTRINGLEIQWYTPSFGGGLPGFPNPQHLQYSLVQWISYLINPWAAVLVSTTLISIVGYYYFYKFLEENLELDWRASTLGAMFFIGNGFFIRHLIAGQMGYQLFPLSGILLYSLTQSRRKPIFSAAIIAIVVTMVIYQAGFYLIIILTLSLAMTLPILYLYKPQVLELRRLFWTAIFSMVLFFAMSASKLYASLSFLHHFPREVADTYNVGLFQALLGVLAQLLGVMNLGTLLFMLGFDPGILTGILVNITGAEYGLWETDAGLSPVLLLCLAVATMTTVLNIMRGRVKLTRFQWVSIALFLLAAWITMELALARGTIYSTVKLLPVIKSLHINVRFVSALIIPLIIIGSLQASKMFVRIQGRRYFLIAVLLTIASLCSYFLLSRPIHQRDYDVRFSNSSYTSIRSGSRLPVTVIADIDVWQGFSEGKSSIKPYEPIFGYKLEEFNPLIQLGSVLEIDHDYYNMTHPASLVFPEINNTHTFERIKITEKDKLEAFIHYQQPEWKIPAAQKILNMISPLAFIFSIAVLLYQSWIERKT